MAAQIAPSIPSQISEFTGVAITLTAPDFTSSALIATPSPLPQGEGE
jgi:hypothetical protein